MNAQHRSPAVKRRLSLALGLAWLAPIAAAQTPDPFVLAPKLVQDLHDIFGVHHARAVHAKGVILEGSFTPTPEARALSTAVVFTQTLPVTVRFSDFTGLPAIPDTEQGASPRGFAMKFQLPGGDTMDIVSHSFNGFPVPNATEFGTLLRAIADSGPTAAKPTPLDTYLATHPKAKAFLTAQKPPPASFATTAFFGVNAFGFTDAKGHKTAVRYRFVPEAGESYLTPAVLKTKGPDYLRQEIASRVAHAPVQFIWFAQIAEPGDKTDDPSSVWPESRRLVRLGTISITKLAADQKAQSKALLFLPATVPAGIEPLDPMLDVRNAAYPISAAERQ